MGSLGADASPVYLDWAGAAQPLPGLLDSLASQMQQVQLANPHSRNASSRATTEMVDAVRHRLLAHFNTTKDEYSLVFTSGATEALRLVGDCFQFADDAYVSTNNAYYKDTPPLQLGNAEQPCSFELDSTARLPMIPKLVYLADNHTSVLGMRRLAGRQHVQCICIQNTDQIKQLAVSKPKDWTSRSRTHASLFVLPAQSNFDGRKYPLQLIQQLRHVTSGCEDYYVCLDAASLVASSPLDLSTYQPDFVAMSFYKMFGFPTGIGALLVHKSAQHRLQKTYFGGGTVDLSLPGGDLHKFRDSFHESFEDGTLNYHGVLAVGHGLDALARLGGIGAVQKHAHAIGQYTVRLMQRLKHHNGQAVVKIYGNVADYEQPADRQGPIVNFNILRDDASVVGYTEVEKMAELYNIELRTGCFCNQGACMQHLGITQQQLIKFFQSGKKCGDTLDVVEGQPLGSVRVSFGAGTTTAHIERLLAMLYDCFVVGSPATFADLLASVPVPSSSVLIQPANANASVVKADKQALADATNPMAHQTNGALEKPATKRPTKRSLANGF